MSGPTDQQLMRRALRLAERGWGRVAPNPMVGALVVRDGTVIAEGWHADYGGPHAEVAALRAAGDAARGATLYVTLEPCAHHGKTPPCTEAILAAGIRTVIYAASDPNPRAGGGAASLAGRGIDVHGGIEAGAARRLDAAFFHRHERGSCYVALKLALSLDGKLGRGRGGRTRLTGAPANRVVQRLRAGFDAIMVGSGTIRADDPLLTVRGDVHPRVTPKRVVLDSQAGLSPQSRLAETAREAPVWLFCDERADAARRAALERCGVRVLVVPGGTGGVALDAVLHTLWSEGIGAVLCEGGARLAAALLAAGRVKRQYLFYAPLLLGMEAVEAFPLAAGCDVGTWRLGQLRRHGQDVLLALDRAED